MSRGNMEFISTLFVLVFCFIGRSVVGWLWLWLRIRDRLTEFFLCIVLFHVTAVGMVIGVCRGMGIIGFGQPK